MVVVGEELNAERARVDCLERGAAVEAKKR